MFKRGFSDEDYEHARRWLNDTVDYDNDGDARAFRVLSHCLTLVEMLSVEEVKDDGDNG
jgi:hypothetical protein